MSRLEFRGQVQLPRSLCSFALVAIASLILALSGTVSVLGCVLQTILIGAALILRRRPHAWQQSPFAIRLGVCLALGLSLATWSNDLVGPVAMTAMLLQGLQLLDARPRRTEYPVVTLGLFQVVLAASLSEHLFFLPLLVLFVLAAVWTLLQHTLQVEASEAGDASAAYPFLGSRLLRMVLLSTALTGFIAAALFIVLPRMQAALHHPSGEGLSQGLSGFSDRVRLGALGQIRRDPTVQLRVSSVHGTLPARDVAYLRGVAFDNFDGWEWSVTPLPTATLYPSPRSTSFPLRIGKGSDLISVVREPMSRGVLFTPEGTVSVESSMESLREDRNGNLLAPDSDSSRVAYKVNFQPNRVLDTQLEHDHVAPPRDAGARYLRLPDDPGLAAFLRKLGHEITGDTQSDAERIRRLERYLIDNGSYTDTPPYVDRGNSHSPVQVFLQGGLAGHCEYFASSMVLLARALDIPARLVNGFAGGHYNPAGQFLEFAGSDAHAWVEIHYAKAGWVRYDPTPADLRMRPLETESFATRLRGFFEAGELWWFRNVADFNRNTQLRAVHRGKASFVDLAKRIPYNSKKISGWIRGILRDLPLWLILVVSGTLIVLAVPILIRRRARHNRFSLPEYTSALRLLRRRRLVPTPTTTPRDFVRQIEKVVPPGAATAFAKLTESYQAQRYGGHKSSTARAELGELRDNLRR